MGGVRIEAVDLLLCHGETRALDGLSLEVPAGRITAVVGPSGAGKTTLLHVVAGLAQPDRGDVRFDGDSVLALPPERRDLGVVFQSYALFPHLSVAENVAFGLRVRGTSGKAARQQVAEVLERLEIAALAERRPSQLSGGERQRVALARALAFGPRALLLDEPLAALDARLRLALRSDLAARLRGAGVTALYVTHDQEEAMEVGDRIAVLRAGRLEQVGSAEELYRRPATPFVARFFGQANFLDGVWDPAAGCFTGAAGRWSLNGEVAGLAGPARLMLRPAAFRIARDGEEPQLRAEVLSATFFGNRRRLEVRVEGPAGDLLLKVDLDPAVAVAVGERLPLRLDLAAAVLLPDSVPEGL